MGYENAAPVYFSHHLVIPGPRRLRQSSYCHLNHTRLRDVSKSTGQAHSAICLLLVLYSDATVVHQVNRLNVSKWRRVPLHPLTVYKDMISISNRLDSTQRSLRRL